jgi:hypothetical protein
MSVPMLNRKDVRESPYLRLEDNLLRLRVTLVSELQNLRCKARLLFPAETQNFLALLCSWQVFVGRS